MKVWKWFGWNTRETRERMNQDNNQASVEKTRNSNWHSTVQTVMICVVLAVGLYACAQTM